MSLTFESKYYQRGYTFIAGTDEAGRGPLAGPLVAAAVVFPQHYLNPEIDDSKKISDKKRRKLFDEIIANALAYAIVVIDPVVVDQLNIYTATQKAMREALNEVYQKRPFGLALTDAMPLPLFPIEVEPIIHGDQLSQSIAAASILAKVTRDDIMLKLDIEYPDYGFKNHKGYGTKVHLEALKKHGPIRGVHRFTFRPVQLYQYEQLKLF